MTELPAYLVGLIMACLACLMTAHFHRASSGPLVRTACMIALNWVAGTLYVAGSGDYTPWAFSILIDVSCAAAIMAHPAGRMQAYIGLFYCLQIAFHCGFGLHETTGMPANGMAYYDAITWIAWGQLAAMGAWCVGILVGDHRRGNRHPPLDRAGHHHIGGAA